MNTAQSNKKLLSLLTAAGLVLTLLCVALPYTAFADPDSWVNEIDQMLAAGDYLEGEVLVGIVEPEKSDTLSAQASSLLDRAEPLMETTLSSLNESESALTAQGDKPMTVSFISSNEMTTEELLHALADDPRVVFAEPNYRTKLTDEDIEDALASAEDPNSDDVSADVTPDDDTPVPSDDPISDDSSTDDSSTDDTGSDDDVLVPTEDPTDDTPKDVIPSDDKPSDDKPSDDKADDKPSDDKKDDKSSDDKKDDKADDKTDDKDVPAADEEIIVIPVDNDDKSDGSNSGNSGQNSGQNASDPANTTPSTTVPTATVNYTRPTGTLPSVRPNLVTSAPQGDGVQLTAAASTGIADLTGFQWANSNKTSVRVDELGGKNPTGAINVKDFGPTGSNMKNTVVVAVLDNLVDYRLADLSGQVYQFSAEQQKSLGCYQWGYNAVNGGGQQASDFKIDDHATHCAGIIASAWDGEGTSGIASRARIMSIQVAGPKSEQITSDAFVRACAFIDKYNASCAENKKQNVRIFIKLLFKN